jgi:hypothetical protein
LKWLRRYKYTWLIGGLVLLALTFIVGGIQRARDSVVYGIMVFFRTGVSCCLYLFTAYLAEKRACAQPGRTSEQHHNLTLPYLMPLLAMWA